MKESHSTAHHLSSSIKGSTKVVQSSAVSSVEVTLKQFTGGGQSAAHLVKALLSVVDGLPVMRADEEPA